MTIDPINGRASTPASAKPQPKNAVSTGNAEAPSKTQGDSIAISNNSARINKALESAPASQAVDNERVSAIKQALANGTYSIDAEKIAQKISQFDSLFNGDST